MAESPNERLLRLFHQALEHPPESRETFVLDETGDDLEMRAEILELLGLVGSLDQGLGPEADLPLDLDAFVAGLPARVGEFAILDVLARGATSVVCRARRQGPGTEVALKILFPQSESHDKPNLLRREMEALRGLEHPGIARLLDWGTFECEFGTCYFLAMEFVDGVPLSLWLEKESPSLAAKIELIASLSDIADHAHARDVIHRDIKPDNILIRSNGAPVLLDFGLARLPAKRTATSSLASRIGQLVGTVRYMSPEQARADPTITQLSDVYTLGVLGFELLTGKLPYALTDENVPGAIVAINREEPALAGDENPELRGGIERTLARALAKSPSARPRTAGEFAHELRAAARVPPRRAWRPSGRSWLAIATTAGILLALIAFMMQRDARVIDGHVTNAERAAAHPIEVVAVDPEVGTVLTSTTAREDGRFRLRGTPTDRDVVLHARAGTLFAAQRHVPRGRSRRGDLRLELRGLPPGCSADSLVAWWPADGDLGDVAGGHNATTGVRVPFVAGVHDRAFVFDDSCPAGLRVAEDHAFRNLGAFTIEAWIRPVYDTSPRINVLDGIFGRAVGCDRIGMSFSLTVYKTSSEATICFYMADSTSHEIEAYGPSTTIPRDDDFHHVAATYDGRSMAIFIDGRLARTMANPNARFPAAGNLRIGHHPECSSLTYTAIDELRFFRRALEASEVASIHASRTQAAAARAP